MYFLGDERIQKALMVAFFITVGIAIGLGAYHANGAEMDGAWFGQSALVLLAFTFAMRTSQEFRESRERHRAKQQRARRGGDESR